MNKEIYQPYPVGNKSFSISHDCDFNEEKAAYVCNKCGKSFYISHPRAFYDEPEMFTDKKLDYPTHECDNFPEVYILCEEDNPKYRTEPKKCVVLQKRRGGYVLVQDESGDVSPLAFNSLKIANIT